MTQQWDPEKVPPTQDEPQKPPSSPGAQSMADRRAAEVLEEMAMHANNCAVLASEQVPGLVAPYEYMEKLLLSRAVELRGEADD